MSKNPESVPPERPTRRVGVCAAGSADLGPGGQGQGQPNRRRLIAKHPAGSCLPGTMRKMIKVRVEALLRGFVKSFLCFLRPNPPSN